MDRVMGSRAFTATVRSVLFAVPEPRPNDSHVYLIHTKCNLGMKTPTLGYTLSGEGLEWDCQTHDVTAEEALAAFARGRQKDQSPATKAEAAQDFLQTLLAAGPVTAIRVIELAKAAGHSEETIRRAKKAMGIVASKGAFSGSWEWSLTEAKTDDNDGFQ